jgi:hypothetical protein
VAQWVWISHASNRVIVVMASRHADRDRRHVGAAVLVDLGVANVIAVPSIRLTDSR